MRTFEQAEPFIQALFEARSEPDIADILREACASLGFRYFALAHHVDVRTAVSHAIRIHNYPDGWVEYYERNALGVSDPVHRGAQRAFLGFAWSHLPNMIEMTRGDIEILDRGQLMGIGDGFTVPAHIPGEIHGSCSFANPKGVTMPQDHLQAAQLVGAHAFEAARRLWRERMPRRVRTQRITDRQREVLLWITRGKSISETAQILGISELTVRDHMKAVREHYGVQKQSTLPVHALFDGSIGFGDVIGR